MDGATAFIAGYVLALASVLVTTVLVLAYGYILRGQPTINRKKAQVRISQNKAQKERAYKDPPKQGVEQLGAVSRPTVEDIELRNNPTMQAEEEAWDNDIAPLLIKKKYSA